MTRYETLMLATPDIGQEGIATIENYISELLSKSKGKMLSFDIWGKYKLSYPVKKHEYGVYVLARFELDKENMGAIEELNNHFKIKFNDIVMRFINRQLSDEDSLEYQKPEAIVAGDHGVGIVSDSPSKEVEAESSQEAPAKSVSALEESAETSEDAPKEVAEEVVDAQDDSEGK
ncbi:30S ribosomal protein S6 [bacterium]|nr:30S ribosomal protein S6 [bacterium]